MASVPTAAPESAGKKKKVEDVGQIPQWKLMIRRFRQSRLSVAGGIVLILMYLTVILAEFIAPNDYQKIEADYQYARPSEITFSTGWPGIYAQQAILDKENFTWTVETDYSTVYPINFFVEGHSYSILGIFRSNIHLFGVQAPAKLYFWGADGQGRDIFARVLKGGQVSMSVGLVGVTMVIVLGSIIGTASGYFGGMIDNLMQRTIELIQSFPTLPLWLALAAALPREMPVVQRYFFITLVLALVDWTGLARQVRGKVMAYRSADYTAAALAAGGSHMRIILTHMIPNALSHIIVVAALAIPGVILGETALSFLGLGMLPPAVSWGVLLRDAQQVQVIMLYPWMLMPGIAVVLAVLCFNLLADGLRDAVDPYG
jgi:peptide/nickel transport system permease protein